MPLSLIAKLLNLLPDGLALLHHNQYPLDALRPLEALKAAPGDSRPYRAALAVSLVTGFLARVSAKEK